MNKFMENSSTRVFFFYIHSNLNFRESLQFNKQEPHHIYTDRNDDGKDKQSQIKLCEIGKP